MMQNVLRFVVPILLFAFCKNQNGTVVTEKVQKHCDKRDTVIHLTFLKDTNFQDFYRLLDFLEQKTDFRRYDTYNRKKTVPITKHNEIELQMPLCEDFFISEIGSPKPVYNSIADLPLEKSLLKDVCSITCMMKSLKPVKGTTDYFPNFWFRQINFATEAQKDSVLAMINSKGWGDPRSKWNKYSIASGKKRIYVLETHDATFKDYDEKYALFIQKEWIDKQKPN